MKKLKNLLLIGYIVFASKGVAVLCNHLHQEAHWKKHYIYLQAGKYVLGMCAAIPDAELVSQIKIIASDGEELTIVTERDRKNNFIKTLYAFDSRIVARLEYRFTAESCCYIKGVYSFVRKKGYGSLLLKNLMKEVTVQGYTIVELHALKSALSFYKKHGFHTCSRLVSPDVYPRLIAMAKYV